MGTEGGDKCVDNVDKLRKKWWGGEKGTNPEEVCNTTGRQRGQGNFELAANFGYSSRGSADPRESLRKCWISKIALNAQKVLSTHGSQASHWFWQTALSLFVTESCFLIHKIKMVSL